MDHYWSNFSGDGFSGPTILGKQASLDALTLIREAYRDDQVITSNLSKYLSKASISSIAATIKNVKSSVEFHQVVGV